MRRMWIFWAALGVACSFDSAGRDTRGVSGDTDTDGGSSSEGDDGADDGDDGEADDGDDGGDDTSPPADDGDPSDSGPGDSGNDTNAEGDATAGEEDDGAEGSDDGVVDCNDPFEVFIWASEAQVTDPMSLVTASSAMNEPRVAVSGSGEEGVATFEFDVPCGGTYYAWGLVWDYLPGRWPADPDSFYVSVGGDEWVWHYGCQTFDVDPSEGLSWQRLEGLGSVLCEDAYRVDLEAPDAGTYGIRFRNRESGIDSAVAGIAAVVVTNDPDKNPYDLYAPY